MPSLLEKIQRGYERYGPFLDRLETAYAGMGRKYDEAADHYGFHCSGCTDNCCRTRFYHHTLLEYLHLMKGYHTLDPDRQAEVSDRAREVSNQTAKMNKKGAPLRLMCPLNLDGLCLLYDYRPMICRLHGIAYELHRPGRKVFYGPGCEAFTAQCGPKGYFTFDRTPFYKEMARLEGQLREVVGMKQKIKMTIAEMLLA